MKYICVKARFGEWIEKGEIYEFNLKHFRGSDTVMVDTLNKKSLPQSAKYSDDLCIGSYYLSKFEYYFGDEFQAL